MKKILIPIYFFSVINLANSQSVGIGTSAPSANAILDITSSNKGLMLPRLNDTTYVINPSAGLFIYNKNTNSPNFYNGLQWNNLATTINAVIADSITYSIAGGTEFGIKTLYQNCSVTAPVSGSTGYGKPQVGDLAFSKMFDINSIDLTKGNYLTTTFTYIEFKFYKSGSATSYYSIKVTAPVVLTYNVLQLNSIDGLTETYTLHFTKIGFKDWINNKSFSYDIQAGTVGTY